MVHATSVDPSLFPYANHVEPVTDLRERGVLRKSEVVGAEYRGRYKDGSHWRWVETPGDLVFYEHLGTESAAYFDRIIDSMCWIERD